MDRKHRVDTSSARCSAHSQQSGKPCQRPAQAGTTVCYYHGGAAPQVRRKAALRLAALVDPAIATLARVMTDARASNADRVRAANSVLDRAGVVRQQDMDLATAQALLIERLEEMARERMEMEMAEEPVVVDGVVVE